MPTIEEFVASLSLAPDGDGDGRYRAPNVGGGPGVIFGGQLLGQSIVAASIGEPDKRVKTVHTIFARAGQGDRLVLARRCC